MCAHIYVHNHSEVETDHVSWHTKVGIPCFTCVQKEGRERDHVSQPYKSKRDHVSACTKVSYFNGIQK
jgi:Ni,Fe-hydrogenase I small subunit